MASVIESRFPRALIPDPLLLLPALLLIVLPMAHVTAMRSLALAGTAAIAFLYWRRLPPPRRIDLPLVPAFALWLLAGLASVPGALDPIDALSEVRKDVVHSVVVFAAFFLFARSHEAFVFFRRIAVAGLLACSLGAAISLHLYGEWRIGFFNALGEYGTFLVITLPLLLTVFLPGRLAGGRGDRILAVLTLAAAIYGAFLSRSRGLWLVLALIIVSALAYGLRRAGWRKTTIAGLGVAVLLVALLAAQVVSQQRNTQLTSLHGRESIYSFAVSQIAARPLTGTGFGRESNRAAWGEAFPGKLLWHSHNAVLSYGEQMGIGGIVAVLVLFGSVAARFLRLLRRRNTCGSILGATGLILCAAYFLKNMTDMFFYGQILLLFWAHVGLLLGLAAHDSAEPASAPEDAVVHK